MRFAMPTLDLWERGSFRNRDAAVFNLSGNRRSGLDRAVGSEPTNSRCRRWLTARFDRTIVRGTQMKPRSVVAVLATLLVSALMVACSSSKSSSGASGSTSQPFKILVPVDLTGANASIGSLWEPAIKASIQNINQHGGILGRQVAATYFDTQSSPQVAAQMMNSNLSSGGYSAIVPASAFGQTLPELQASQKYKTIMVGAGSVSFTDPKTYPYGFFTSFSGVAFGSESACLINSFHPKTVALFYYQTPVAAAEFPGLKPTLAKHNINIVADVGFSPTATNVTPQAEQVVAAKPDVIWLHALGASLNAAVTALNSLGYKGQIAGSTDVSSSPASVAFSDTSVVPKSFVALAPAIQSRVNGVLSANQQTAVNALSPFLNGKFLTSITTYLYAYDAPQLVKWAAEKAKSDKTAPMVSALESLAKHPADTGALGGVPAYSSTYHGYEGGSWYSVDITGTFTDGTLPALQPVPAC
jgi:branched-chain amino acid transport system substrate-binding protein